MRDNSYILSFNNLYCMHLANLSHKLKVCLCVPMVSAAHGSIPSSVVRCPSSVDYHQNSQELSMGGQLSKLFEEIYSMGILVVIATKIENFKTLLVKTTGQIF